MDGYILAFVMGFLIGGILMSSIALWSKG